MSTSEALQETTERLHVQKLHENQLIPIVLGDLKCKALKCLKYLEILMRRKANGTRSCTSLAQIQNS